MNTSSAHIESLLAEKEWIGALARQLVRCPQQADDLAQDTLLAAMEAQPSRIGSLRPWLATVLRNKARDGVRRTLRRSDHEANVAAEERQAPRSPEDLLGEMEMGEVLSSMVRELPAKEREVVVLRYVEGLSAAETGRRLGLAAGTVRWRAKCALDRLRIELDRKHGGDRAAWLAALTPLARRESALAGAGAAAAFMGWKAVAAAGVVIAGAGLFALREPEPAVTGFGAESVVRTASQDDVHRAEQPTVVRPEGVREAAGPPVAATTRPAEDPEDPAAARPVTSVTVSVVDPDEAPLANARVEIVAGPSALGAVAPELREAPLHVQLRARAALQATTDGTGRATISTDWLVDTVDVRIRVRGPRNGEFEEAFVIEPGEAKDLGSVTLAPRARVVGSVLLAGSETPAQGQVEVRGATDAEGVARYIASTSIDAKGEVSLTTEHPGPFELWAREPSGKGAVRIDAGELVLGETFHFEARVDPELFGEAASPVYTAVTEEGLPVRCEYRIIARAEGGEFSSAGRSQDDGTFSLNANVWNQLDSIDVSVRPLDLSLAPRSVHFDAPLSSASITVKGRPSRTLTFDVRAPAARKRSMSALLESDGHSFVISAQAGPNRVALPLGQPVSVEFRSEGLLAETIELPDVARAASTIVVELGPLPGISGVVLADGAPLRRARVTPGRRLDGGRWEREGNALTRCFWSDGLRTRSDRNGAFHLAPDWDHPVILEVTARGHAPALVDLPDHDRAEGVSGLTVELVRGATVEGVVRDHEGKPLAGASVFACHDLHRPVKTRSRRDGRYALEHLAPGDWFVFTPAEAEDEGWSSTLDLPEGWSVPTNVELVDGQRLALDLSPPAPRALRGRIAVEGPPSSGSLSLWLKPAADDPFARFGRASAAVEPDGSFQAEFPGEGAVEVRATGSAFKGAATWTVHPDRLAGELALRLPLTQLELGALGSSRARYEAAPASPEGPSGQAMLKGDGAAHAWVVGGDARVSVGDAEALPMGLLGPGETTAVPAPLASSH